MPPILTKTASVDVVILLHHPRWNGLRPTIMRAAEAALAHQKIRKAALTIVLGDDAEVRALNKAYRKKDKATNVLSFPDGETLDGQRQLGDIILAYETVVREAEVQDKTLKNHVTHLVIHGVLHLLGYDHEIEEEADIMEAYEIRILARMGIANPYESS